MERYIHTRDEAARIVDMFEDVLDRYNISVPSPEDDEREPDNMIGLYGSTFWDLLEEVESALADILEKHTVGTEIIRGVFSGK